MEGKASHNTCFNHMVHRRKPFVHSRAHRAEDEQGREIDIAHQRPSEQAPVLVASVNAAGYEEHQSVWPGQVHELVPPSVHHQSNIKPCRRTRNYKTISYSRHMADADAFSRILAFYRDWGVKICCYPYLMILPSRKKKSNLCLAMP